MIRVEVWENKKCSKAFLSTYKLPRCFSITRFSSPMNFSDSYCFKLITSRDSVHPRRDYMQAAPRHFASPRHATPRCATTQYKLNCLTLELSVIYLSPAALKPQTKYFTMIVFVGHMTSLGKFQVSS